LILSDIELMKIFLFLEENDIDSIIREAEDGKRVYTIKGKDEIQRHSWIGELQPTKQQEA